MKKRTLAFILCLVMIVGIIVPGTLATEIPESDPAEPPIPELPQPEPPAEPVVETTAEPIEESSGEIPEEIPVEPTKEPIQTPTATEAPEAPAPVEKSLYERLMEAESLADFELIALEAGEDYLLLIREEIIDLYKKLAELYEDIDEPTDEYSTLYKGLTELLYLCPNAPICPECGQFDAHLEGCSLTLPVEEAEPQPDEDITQCTCGSFDGIHVDTCPLYVAPECNCGSTDGIHADTCPLYVAPQCTCGTGTNVHTEGCPLFTLFTVSFISYYDGQETGCVELETAGDLISLPDGSGEEFASFLREGKVIYCWSEIPGEIDHDHAVGREFHVSADTELFAVWIDSEYPITYEMDGSFLPEPAPCSYTFSPAESILEIPAPEREGYVFAGWNISGEGNWSDSFSTESIDLGGKYGLLRLSAQWKEQDVTINYMAGDGGTVSLASEILPRESGVAQGSLAQANEGYEFVGWYDSLGQLVSLESLFVPEKAIINYSPVDGENVQPSLVNLPDTYTAKFQRATTSLSIYADSTGTVFKVSGEGRDTLVTVGEKGYVSLAGLGVGETYIVTPVSCDWRCVVSPQQAHVRLDTDGGNNIVGFSLSQVNSKWLSGDSSYTQ